MSTKSKNPTDQKTTEDPTKCKRQRKKNYFNLIRKQMEFYFGDANLTKDRFLMSLIKVDSFVPLSTFMTFNKIKWITKNVEDIAKALSNSELLELNETRTAVRRRTEIPTDRNVDDCTIYVESIPQDATHDWIIKVFSRYGPVAYVSLPRYKISKRLKEFGFVEFENSISVTKALNAFQDFNGILAGETARPEELISVKAFISEQKQIDDDAAAAAAGKNEKPDKIIDKNSENFHDSHSDSSSDISQPPIKRKKLQSDTETPTSELENDEKMKTKRRNRKKSSKRIITTVGRSDQVDKKISTNTILDFNQLRITSKREWKRLRNRYLNLQREKMSELKNRQRKDRPPIDKLPANKTEKLPIHRNLHHMNFYQDRGDPEQTNVRCSESDGGGDSATLNNSQQSNRTEQNANILVQRQSSVHYESGLIIAIRLLEPRIDLKGFKEEMRQYDQVKYVDIKEGAVDAYLRCESAISAQKLCRQINCAEYTCEILIGDREQTYWQKIMQDRAEKLNKTVKVRSRRNRGKIKQMINTHLRFCGDD